MSIHIILRIWIHNLEVTHLNPSMAEVPLNKASHPFYLDGHLRGTLHDIYIRGQLRVNPYLGCQP